jgi:hypothetical protein
MNIACPLGGHTEFEEYWNYEWMAWWAPALHILIYVLGCQEPIAALTRRLDGDREDDHKAWALLEAWWGADLRGFAAWGLRNGLDGAVAEALYPAPVARVARYGSLADSPREWTQLAIEAGVVLGRDGDSFHLSYHFSSPLDDSDDVDVLFRDDGPLVLTVPTYRGWYRALLGLEEAADRPAEDLDELRRRRHRARIADTVVLELSVLVCLARVGPVTAGVWGRAKEVQLTPAELGKHAVLEAKMPRLGGTQGGVVQTREVGLKGWVVAPHCGQQTPGLGVVDDDPAVDRLRDDRAANLQLLERIVRQELQLHGVLEGTEQRRALVPLLPPDRADDGPAERSEVC